jgi:REP element-mobilizing transposase RayT
MLLFRGAFVEGASYFFTVVTFNRLAILTIEPLKH